MLRLPWFENGDRLDVAIAANAAARAGLAVSRALDHCGALERGDYLVESAGASRLRASGLVTQETGPAQDAPLRRVHAPRIALLAGSCSAYPYYGYYALALLRLGHVFTIVDGAHIAAGALDEHDLLVLPGGFSNWTLDLKEQTRGADDAVRRFLLRGGAVVASCGGAFYLSRGRPGWLGVADARPFNTQEYLRTGVGILTCSIEDEALGLALPPTLEIPYFHGPVWDEIGEASVPLMSFRDHYGHGRLFIDNALSRETFEREMQGRVAALRTEGRRGRSILFSPHPEMGDLLRKYMALETYIPRYQPVRGDLVMRETLATFRPEESRAFLLVLNAIENLADRPSAFSRPAHAECAAPAVEALAEAWNGLARAFKPSEGGLGRLEAELLDGFTPRFERAASALSRSWSEASAELRDMATRLASDIAPSLARPAARRPAEALLELELACLLLEAWLAVAETEKLS